MHVSKNGAHGKLECRIFQRRREGITTPAQRQCVLPSFLARVYEIPFTQQKDILHQDVVALFDKLHISWTVYEAPDWGLIGPVKICICKKNV